MIQLNYKDQGSRFPLLLLHGNGEDISLFDPIIDQLSKHFHVYALDTRGHGKSPRGKAPFTIRQFVEDLNHFMSTHGIKKAHLFGFSDGANIAMLFAIKYPEKVEKLILNGGNLDPSGVSKKVQRIITLEYYWNKGMGNKKETERLGLMVNDPNIPIKSLEKIQNKTLVIAGIDDLIKREHTKTIYRTIPKANLALVKGAHNLIKRNPEEFQAILLPFLLKP